MHQIYKICLNEFSTVWGGAYTGRPGQTAPPPLGDTGANIQLADSSAAVLGINHYSGVHAKSPVIQFSFTNLYLGLPPLFAIEVRSITPSGCWHTQPGLLETPWHTVAWP